jgi:hypothetical protein
MKKTILFSFLIFLMGAILVSQEKDTSGLNEKDKEALVKLVFTPKSFMESADVRLYPETLVLFKKNIYEKMKGNLFLGYQFDDGVSLDTKEVQFVHLGCLKGLEKYKEPFIEVMKRAWESEGYRFVDESHIKMGVALVSVVPEKTDESFPGLVIECYFQNEKLLQPNL